MFHVRLYFFLIGLLTSLFDFESESYFGGFNCILGEEEAVHLGC